MFLVFCVQVLIGFNDAYAMNESWNFSGPTSLSKSWDGEVTEKNNCAKTSLKVELSKTSLTVAGTRSCDNGKLDIKHGPYKLKGNGIYVDGKKFGDVDRSAKTFTLWYEFYDDDQDRHYEVVILEKIKGEYSYRYHEGIQAEESYRLEIPELDLQ